MTDGSWDPPTPSRGDEPGFPEKSSKWYSRKIGPLPVWAWLAAAFVVIGAIGNFTETDDEAPAAEPGLEAVETASDQSPDASETADQSEVEPTDEVVDDDPSEDLGESSRVAGEEENGSSDSGSSDTGSSRTASQATQDASDTPSDENEPESAWDPAEVTEVEAESGSRQVESLAIAPEPERTGYSRTSWQHWRDVNGSGCTAREDVLIAQAAPGATIDPSDPCKVKSGTWFSAWDGVTHSGSPSDLDMDHIVALAEAHDSGGSNWDSATKRRFANDPANLVAVTASSNRSKSDRDLAEWRPARNVWCSTATTVVSVKAAYGLTVDQSEYNALVEMLSTCGSAGQISLGVPPSQTQTVSTVASSTSAPVTTQAPTTTQAPSTTQPPSTSAPATTTPPAITPPVTAAPTTAAPAAPANPGDTKNCGDFGTYAEAKNWFDTYFPYYGDVARLDRDGDGEPCESLPGGP